jgi:translation initiation factor 2 gamma subunit (eIF-2gamma)
MRHIMAENLVADRHARYLASQEREIAAALPHLRVGRRRQVDADRPPALRQPSSIFEDQLARSRKRRAASTARPATTSISRCWSTGWRPSASRASPSTSPIASFDAQAQAFIVADTPGHEQYTRNMATGASTADLAIMLIDARKGLLPQTRRHSFRAC